MSVIGGIFNLAGEAIKYSFWSIVVVSTVAFFTKPSDEFLDATLKREFRTALRHDANAPVLNLAAKLVPVSVVTDKYTQDYVLFKVAQVSVGKQERQYLGAFNNWFFLRVPRSV